MALATWLVFALHSLREGLTSQVVKACMELQILGVLVKKSYCQVCIKWHRLEAVIGKLPRYASQPVLIAWQYDQQSAESKLKR